MNPTFLSRILGRHVALAGLGVFSLASFGVGAANWPSTRTSASAANADWSTYLGDKGRSLYSPLRQINRENVTQLQVAWTYDTGDKGEYQANNLIIKGVLYVPCDDTRILQSTPLLRFWSCYSFYDG